MARLHTRKKGKSSSKKPVGKRSVGWIRASKSEVEAVIEKLAREGESEARIGVVLRDQYGVPNAKLVLGQSISSFLKEKNLAPKFPSDLMDLIRTAVGLRKHLKQNPRDVQNKVKLTHIESKIRRLVRYYRGKKLPKDWTYVPEEAALLVK